MSRTSTLAALQRAFSVAFERDSGAVVLGEGVSRTFGLGGIYHGIAQAYPDRVIETPVAERASLGVALGMALAGRKVIVEISAAGRLHSTLEILAEIGQIASQREFTPSIVVRVPVGGQAGPSIDRPITAALASLPGLRVVSPSTPDRVVATWRAVLSDTGPLVVLEPRDLLDGRCAWPEPIALDQAELLRDGTDLTLLSWGSGVGASLHAAESLQASGISAQVLDLHSLAPLDSSTIGAQVRQTGRAVLVEPAEGGLGGALLGSAVEQAFLYLQAPLLTCSAQPDRIVAAAAQTAQY